MAFRLLPPVCALVVATGLSAALGPIRISAAAEEKPAKGQSAQAQPEKGKAAVDSASEPENQPKPQPARIRKPTTITVHPSMLAVIPASGGRNTLDIEYRWNLHEKASIEVRLIPGQIDDATTVIPDFFVGEFFKGKIEDRIYKCLDNATDRFNTDSFTKYKMVYKIVGDRNSLGRGSVYILPYNEGSKPEDRPGAVFLQLDTWAVNDHLLSLDMPREVFAKSGTLFVWFIRGDKIVWQEKVAWPGN